MYGVEYREKVNCFLSMQYMFVDGGSSENSVYQSHAFTRLFIHISLSPHVTNGTQTGPTYLNVKELE